MPETYKKLGSVVATGDNEHVLYTTPTSKQSLISNITVTNRSSSSASFDINIHQSGAEPFTSSASNALYKESIVGANKALILEPGIALSSQNSIVIKDYSTKDGFVYIKYNSNLAQYRFGNTAWTTTTMPSSQYWYGIKYGNNIFVATAGYDSSTAAAASSTDGIIWTARTLPSSQNWGFIAYGNSVFVVAGGSRFTDSTAAAYSTDGITWNATTMSTNSRWNDISYGNNTFVAVSGYGTNPSPAAISTNGIIWTSTTLPTGATTVAFGNNIFIYATRGSNQGGYSTDGITWTVTTLPVPSGFSPLTWKKMIFANGKHVVINDRGAASPSPFTGVASTTDGVSWTLSTTGVSHTGIAFGNNTFIVIGYGSERISTDAITWTTRTSVLSDKLWALESFPAPGDLTFSTYGVELS